MVCGCGFVELCVCASCFLMCVNVLFVIYCDVVGAFVLVCSFNVLARFVFDLSCDVSWLAFAWCFCG